jgi:hypothetical protein
MRAANNLTTLKWVELYCSSPSGLEEYSIYFYHAFHPIAFRLKGEYFEY